MKKEKINGLLHIAAGLIVLYHGFDNFEAGEFLSAFIYLSLAILYMLVAGLHKSIVRRFLQANTAFFLLESVTIFYSAWHYKTKNQVPVYYLFTLAGIIFFILAIKSIKTEKPKRRHRRRRRRHSSDLNKDVSDSRFNNHNASSS